ncbi:MAG TPA: cysteine--tRNA ligase [Candidatus Humimicrobiaceae bacterium]|nr:cysteine--tRNA ligase [Candidatus Humimicrobiaceae bacterium]
MLRLYNTLSRKKDIFKPLKDRKAGLYTCGPTVYWFAHIGNLRTFTFEDILKRVLEYNGYKVKHVMNVTDVGHLTSDADTGEDKMEIGAKREEKTAWQIAEFYTKSFKKDLKLLNIKEPDIWVKATETIDDQINLIKILEKKGFTYKIADGVYFDTSKAKNYGKLTGQKKKKLKAGARVEMVPGKKSPADFALWKFTPAGVKRQMEWDSPWGRGFPGWHTECVVMAAKYLGIPLDIHCGGIDHIAIHHTNEIAQSEAAFGKNLARFWLHGEFLKIDRGRMGKSEGNIVILKDLIKKGFNPLAYRYLCLTTHYMSKLNFSWPALESAQNALNKLYEKMRELKFSPAKLAENKSSANYQKKFLDFINDNLDMPRALALTWKIIKDKRLNIKDKRALLLDFDKVLGLNLAKVKKPKVSQEIKKLVKLREKYRRERTWLKADEVRKKIKQMGYWVEDTKQGPKIKRVEN